VVVFGTPVKLQLDELSAPGFVVAVLWVVFEVFLLIFYFNIAEEVRTKRKTDRIRKRQEARVNDLCSSCSLNTPSSSSPQFLHIAPLHFSGRNWLYSM
jgi:hypothetical protein